VLVALTAAVQVPACAAAATTCGAAADGRASTTRALHPTVATQKSPAQLSEFLVAPSTRVSRARAEIWPDDADAATEPGAGAREAAGRSGVAERFADELTLVDQTGDARAAFALGGRAFAAQHPGDALVHFPMGHALAPGFLRELGGTDDKPGRLRMSSSSPFAVRSLHRPRRARALPDAGPGAGDYKGPCVKRLCVNPKLEIARFEYATVEPGKTPAFMFRWGIIENRPERALIDPGIAATEVGVAVPADRRKLEMVRKDDSGGRTETRSVQIEPAQRLVVKW